MSNFFQTVKNYLSLVKFSHTIFAMPFALIGFSLAVAQGGGEFSIRILVLVVLCMVFARNAAMGFNRVADLQYDALNPRTKNREIPSGLISKGAASIFVVVNSLLFIVAAGLINKLTLFLSPVALLVVLGYSLTKRFTSLCHFILGLGLSLAPIGAYISVTGSFELLPIIYSFIVLTWVGGFDIIYSLQDGEFDNKNNLYSIPSSSGVRGGILISVIVHCVTVALVVLAGIIGNGGVLFLIGSSIFIALLFFQHFIVRADDLSRVNLAFGTTNGIASILFALFVILDLFLGKA